jgi:hypothetical protein
MSPAIEEDLLTDLQVDTDSGDHDVFAHYVEKEEVTEALVNGWPVVALCGKIWVPFRDPSRYPICPTCQEIYKQMTEDLLG